MRIGRRHSYTPMYFSLACAVFLTLTGWSALQEVNLYFSGGSSPFARLRIIADGSRLPGLSTDSQAAYLGDCLASQTSLAAAYLPRDEQIGLTSRCLAAAVDITRAAPVFSYAWFALARLSLEAGRADDFNRALVRSEATGPNEGWIVHERVMLAADNYGLLSDAANAAHDRDLSALAGARLGGRSVAALYVVNADFRERFVPVLETLPIEAQRRFISQTGRILNSRALEP